MSEPVPPGAPLLRSAAAPAGGGLCGAAGSGASVLFPQHLEGKQTGLMKNTHGKCFIISSSSPTALWHGSVIRKGFSPLGGSLPPRGEAERGGRRPRLCHFLSDRFGGICSDFLPATAPRSHPSLPSSALAARPAMKLYYLLRVLGVWWWGGGLDTLDTKLSQPSKAEKWVRTPGWILTSEEGWQGHTISPFAEQLVGS